MINMRKSFCGGIILVAVALLASPENGPNGWMTRQMTALSQDLVQAQTQFGPDSPLIEDKIVAYADMALECRDYDKALSLYERARKNQAAVFQNLQGQDTGPLFARRVFLLVRTGNVLFEQGKWQEALQWYSQAERMSQRGVDAGGPEVRELRTMMALANLYRLPVENVDYFYAQLYRAALEAYPRNHPDIAKVLLAWFTFRSIRDDHKGAIQLAEECLEVTKQAYRENHPRVADVQSRLASLYFDAGPRRKVKPLLEAALKIRRDAFGEQHELTKRATSNLEQE